MKTFGISDQLKLPLDAVTERLAWLGQSGSGKTYGAMKLAEEMLDRGAQIVALDPVGVWNGLRIPAKGGRGFAIPVFGGLHGDIPLAPTAGVVVANTIVSRNVSAVVDVSDFTIGDQARFTREFAEAFFDAKKRRPSPVHLFLEEAHTFLPEKPPPDPNVSFMLSRVERIIRVGRNFGVGSSQISQMPQAVTKKTLNQVSTLFAFRTIGKHERKAIAAWFDQHGGEELVKEISALPTGTAWCVSPQWLGKTVRLTFLKKRTVDSSGTPKFGSRIAKPKELSKLDVKELTQAMGAALEQAQKEDPRALMKKVADLERELAIAKKIVPVAVTKPEVPVKEYLAPWTLPEKRKFSKRLDEALHKVIQTKLAANDLLEKAAQTAGTAQSIEKQLADLHTDFAKVREKTAPLVVTDSPQNLTELRRSIQVKAEKVMAFAPTPRAPRSGKADGGMARMVAVLDRAGPLELRPLALLSYLTPDTGTFNAYVSRLKTAGLVEPGRSSVISRVPGSVAPFEVQKNEDTSADVIERWLHDVGDGGENRILTALTSIYPKTFDGPGLAEASVLKFGSGTFNAYLSRLRRKGLIEQVGKEYCASTNLYFWDGVRV